MTVFRFTDRWQNSLRAALPEGSLGDDLASKLEKRDRDLEAYLAAIRPTFTSKTASGALTIDDVGGYIPGIDLSVNLLATDQAFAFAKVGVLQTGAGISNQIICTLEITGPTGATFNNSSAFTLTTNLGYEIPLCQIFTAPIDGAYRFRIFASQIAAGTNNPKTLFGFSATELSVVVTR